MTDEQRAQQLAALGENFTNAISAAAETALGDPAVGADAIAIALGAACAAVLVGMATTAPDASDLESPAAMAALGAGATGFMAGFTSALEDITQAVPA